jgi:hypothetical protein
MRGTMHFGLEYISTNENLDAILNALDISADDRVLSICACGAQPLAMLHQITGSGRIVAIDSNKHQLEFVEHILEIIANGHHNQLAEMDLAPRNKGYFSDTDKIDRIHRHKDKIYLKMMDVSKTPRISSTFNKGYFSNAPVDLMEFQEIFEKDSLIYLTEFPFFNNFANEMIDEKSIAKTFIIDYKKTEIARNLEQTSQRYTVVRNGKVWSYGYQWNPVVLRKI